LLEYADTILYLVQAIIKLEALKTANFSMDFLMCNIAFLLPLLNISLLQACVSINNRKKRGTGRIAGTAYGGPLAKSSFGRGLNTAALVFSPALGAATATAAGRHSRPSFPARALVGHRGDAQPLTRNPSTCSLPPPWGRARTRS
jgi:hypothetical protein